MKNLQVLAQDVMDLYYGDFKSDDQFFELDYFERACADAYADILRREYDRQRLLLRGEGVQGQLMVSFDASWLRVERHTVKPGDELALEKPVFSFPFDSGSVGVQNVVPLQRKLRLIRSALDELWLQAYAPQGACVHYWWVSGPGRLSFEGNGAIGEVAVHYVPALDQQTEVPEGLCDEIKKMVLNLLLQARNGQVIDETNDGNQNATLQTESNSSQLK